MLNLTSAINCVLYATGCTPCSVLHLECPALPTQSTRWESVQVGNDSLVGRPFSWTQLHHEERMDRSMHFQQSILNLLPVDVFTYHDVWGRFE